MVYYTLQVNPGAEGRRVDGGPVPPPNALRLPPNVASRPELQKKLGELLDAKARQERLLFEKQKLIAAARAAQEQQKKLLAAKNINAKVI